MLRDNVLSVLHGLPTPNIRIVWTKRPRNLRDVALKRPNITNGPVINFVDPFC